MSAVNRMSSEDYAHGRGVIASGPDVGTAVRYECANCGNIQCDCGQPHHWVASEEGRILTHEVYAR